MPEPHAQTLGSLGEFGFIERIARLAAGNRTVTIGIGDDAAAFHATTGCCCLATADMLLEGIHFDLSYCDPTSLGRKSLAVNLSDIAAMGGRPRSFLLSLAIPPALSVDFLQRLTGGMLQLAAEHDVVLIGGDTCASRSGLVIAITAYGEQQSNRLLKRSGAKPGDGIFVTGTVGDAALGLQLLRQGCRHGAPVNRHLNPAPRIREGTALAESGLPTAMIDISDGLLADLGHLLRNSAVGAQLQLNCLPLSAEYSHLYPPPGAARYDLALTGGEDYELLFTAPPERTREIMELGAALGTAITAIGTITANGGITAHTADGAVLVPEKTGYDHFR